MPTPTNPLKSKTLWAALIVAVTSFIPPVRDLISANPEAYSMVLAGLFGILRVLTKGKLSIE
jgi:hypothetical protein